MKIINVFDGAIVKPGDYFLDPFILFEEPPGTQQYWKETYLPIQVMDLSKVPQARVRLLKLQDNLFSAKALVESERGERKWIPLTVRFTHPKFLFQRVAFINT